MVVPALVSSECLAFAMRYIMTQPAARNVISATVHDGVPAYRNRTCIRRSPRPTLASFGSGIFGGFDAKIIFGCCDGSAGASHANAVRAGPERTSRWWDLSPCSDKYCAGEDNNAECSHRDPRPADGLQEGGVEAAA